ncbi:MAG: SDR family oxidoreductase [Myxococcota bacterium]
MTDGSPIPLRPPIGGEGVHLVTGATGFVGGALVLELLERTDDEIVVLVRSASAETRFRDGLRAAAMAYGRPLAPRTLDRCRVLAGDLFQPGCGVGAVTGRVEQVWHCAASLKYEDRYRDEIRSTNVDGTREVLALAERLGASWFNYVSTAYVAGRREGVILEAAATDGETNNAYEQSKVDAERLVAAATAFRTRIFRPSIVVGHQRTLAATTFSGFYGFARQLVQFRGMVNRTQAGLLDRTPLCIRLDPDARVNLVNVDVVAREAVHVGLYDPGGGFYHLTDPNPPTVGLAVRTIFESAGVREPVFVADGERLGWLDQKFDERLDFYGSYIRGDKQFDRARCDAALGGPRGNGAWTGERIASMARWYLGMLETERRRMPVAR